MQIEYLTAGARTASPGDRVGIDRLIARLEREREASRETMLSYLESLENQGVAGEAARRFGAGTSMLRSRDNGADS